MGTLRGTLPPSRWPTAGGRYAGQHSKPGAATLRTARPMIGQGFLDQPALTLLAVWRQPLHASGWRITPGCSSRANEIFLS